MTSTHLIRLAQALVLAAIIAAFALPATALSDSSSGRPALDIFERYAAAHSFGHGVGDATLSPDVFERYAAVHSFGQGVVGATVSPDVFERYAAAHSFGHGVLDATPAPDVFERYAATHAPTVLTDGRSPDTRDAAEAARLQLAGGNASATLGAASASPSIELVRPGGFDWGDAGIGAIGTAMIIVLLGCAMHLLGRPHRRQRVPLT